MAYRELTMGQRLEAERQVRKQLQQANVLLKNGSRFVGAVVIDHIPYQL